MSTPVENANDAANVDHMNQSDSDERVDFISSNHSSLDRYSNVWSLVYLLEDVNDSRENVQTTSLVDNDSMLASWILKFCLTNRSI